MATGYTQHYGLCQWAGEDKFLREEFNGDNRRVDEALGRVGLGLEDTVYNVYRLTLQHYYEGKETGWKRALLFDGFLSTAGIAQRSPALTVSGGSLSLERGGQENISLGYGMSKMFSSVSTEERTVGGNGLFTGLRFKMSGNSTALTVEYTVTLNGVTSPTRRATFPVSPGGEYEVTLTLPTPMEVRAGDRVQVYISLPGWYLFYAESGRDFLGGVLLFTPLGGSAGTMTSVSWALPAAAGARAWVRHSGGNVALSLVSGGQTRPMIPGAVRTVDSPQGGACQERAFSLAGPLPAGNTAVKLELGLGASPRMEVFDYGVAVV